MDLLNSLLKTHFGYDSFRPYQKEIINHILSQKDALVLMPTGGGKSLCYQLPALYFKGLTLVISPLISLMKDQVDALQANGISAAFINSSLSHTEIHTIQNKAKKGELKILYIAPERIVLDYFMSFLKSLQISLLAIDEAHCISEWGHDFRPDYRSLKRLRQEFPNIPCMALTATATKRVSEDIMNQLHLQKVEVFISSFNRPNLYYTVIPKRNSFDLLIDLLKKYQNEAVIIYCFSRKGTEELAEDLKTTGFKALAYHAGLENKIRKEVQEKFIRDEVPIITATIAFGMGIDKPDVRLIVHYDLPKSLEGYYQETGRAGRDGLSSECVLFYSYKDKMKQNYFIDQMTDPHEQANTRRKLDKMIEYCERSSCRRRYLLEYFGEAWTKVNCGGCDMCIDPLENFDATVITQKILSAVIKTGEFYGVTYVCDILLGKKTQRIVDKKHHQLSVYGIIDDYSENELKQLCRFLIERRYLIKKDQSQYPTYAVSQEGRDFLKNKEKVFLPKPKKEFVLKKPPISFKVFDCNAGLFEELRHLRKKIADERKVPPFIIFGDKALQEMASLIPSNKEEFLQISGVGEKKMEQFGSVFLACIQKYAAENNLLPQERKISVPQIERGSTFYRTLELLNKKETLSAIAQARGLTYGTIVSHIEKIIQSGVELNLDHLKSSINDLDRVKKAFEELGNDRLKPVYDYFGEKYSYDTLRLARLLI